MAAAVKPTAFGTSHVRSSPRPPRREAARGALGAWPGGLQLGGGVTSDNAAEWLDAGASHVIVTSYVFREGRLEEERLRDLVRGWAAVARQTGAHVQGCSDMQGGSDVRGGM
jgi:phosphoribosylformimino-5-aminoimidazole carboxamide ribonucleotide (ProFAR) isomerase